ncbi:hypothetical protein CTI14_53265, partial [Methylobacterium radiotolerans]
NMSVVLQPQISLSTGRVVAAEALSRWVDPKLGALSKPVSRVAMQQAIKNALRSIDDESASPDKPKSVRREVMEAALSQALLSGTNMSVVLQPQISLSTGRVVAAEALSRWVDPKLGA